LGDAELTFQIEPESGIEQIVITQLRLTLKHGVKRRIILEADTKNNALAVYDFNLHSFRKTIAILGQNCANAPEKFKSWIHVGTHHTCSTNIAIGTLFK
jgi:hypothetical protein